MHEMKRTAGISGDSERRERSTMEGASLVRHMKRKRILKWTARALLFALILAFLIGFIAYWRSTNECDRNAGAPANPMKAILHCEYGGPEVLKLEDVEKPTPTDNQILVRVRAASVNPLDLTIRGPWPLRPIFGMRKPKDTRLGVDYAGTVEAVGKNVTQFKPGEEVFGGKDGALADYVCALADRSVVLKPANMTFEQAAAVPVAAITALQGLRDKGKIQAGQKDLVNGASGGVGTFAVQIAKSFGTEVTGVCSTRNLDMVRSIGADHVIYYTQEDFTKNGQQYDLIFDAVGNRSVSEYKRALRPNGIYVATGGSMAQIFQGLLIGPWISMTGSKKLGSLAVKPNKDLAFMKELIEAGKVKPVIDRRYTLSEVAEALRYYGEGHARGKVVITVEYDNKT